MSDELAAVRGLNPDGIQSHTLWIPGRFPALNDIIRAKGAARGRGGASAYTGMKKRLTQKVAELARAARLPAIPRAYFVFEWFERNRQRNPDNVSAGGRKFIFDGLVLARVLANDGWGEIAGFEDYFRVVAPGERDGAWVTIRPLEPVKPARGRRVSRGR